MWWITFGKTMTTWVCPFKAGAENQEKQGAFEAIG